MKMKTERTGMSLSGVLLTMLSLNVAHALIDPEVCKVAPAPIPPPAPEIVNSYSAHVEWKEVLTNKTYTVKEFYDGKIKMGKMIIQSPFEDEAQIFFNYNSKEIYVVKNGLCETKPDLGYYHEGKQWLTPLISVYQTIIQTKDAVYKGRNTTRDYPVDQWETCTFQYPQNITTKLDIYYSVIGWDLPATPPDRPVPVQIRMYGRQHSKKVTEFHVIGDVIEFREFPTFSEDTFVTPPGVFCPGRTLGKPLPNIQESFSMVIEMVDLDFHYVTYNQLWFDGQKEMVRYDTKLAQGSDPDPSSTILDFNTGHRYNTDPYTGVCYTEEIEAGDEFVRSDGNKLYMLSATQYFHLNTQTVQYVGQRRTRGILCDVWVGVLYDVDVAKNMTAEWYFTPRPWTEGVDTLMLTTDFVRMDVWKGVHPSISNIVKYSPLPQTWSTFDFGHCYGPQNKLHFVLYFKIMDTGKFKKVTKPYMKETIVKEVSKRTLLEPNRLSNVLIDYDGRDELFLLATLLDQPPTTNDKMAVSIKPKPLPVVYDFLKGNVETPINILLKNTDDQPVPIKSIRILQLSYPAMFSTTSTHSTMSTSFRIPTLPSTATSAAATPVKPVLKTTEKPHALKTAKTTRRVQTSTTATTTTVWTVSKQTVAKTSSKASSLTNAAWPCLCPTSSVTSGPTGTQQTLGQTNSHSNYNSGDIAGAVIGGMLLGMVLFSVLLFVITRFRYIPFLSGRQEDTEMIPLGKY